MSQYSNEEKISNYNHKIQDLWDMSKSPNL
jgi:hypothetical protein